MLECKGVILNREIDFSRISIHIQKVEEQKKGVAEVRDKDKQAKRARPVDQNYSKRQNGNWGNKWSKRRFWSNAQSSSSSTMPRHPVDWRF